MRRCVDAFLLQHVTVLQLLNLNLTLDEHLTMYTLNNPETELLISYLSASQDLPPGLHDLRTQLQLAQTLSNLSFNPGQGALPAPGDESESLFWVGFILFFFDE